MRTLALQTILTVALCAVPVQAASFVGIKWAQGDGQLVRFDSDQPGVQTIGSSGFSRHHGLAMDSTGSLYSFGYDGSFRSVLIKIDPTTGQGSSVAQLGSSFDPMPRALAFAPAGILYATAFSEGGTDILCRIDPSNGQTTYLGAMGTMEAAGLTFAPDGTLYAYDLIQGLLIVNPNTGHTTRVNNAPFPGWDAVERILPIAASADGILYAASSGPHPGLYTIDPGTGTPTLLRSEPGLAIVGMVPVPEPLTLVGLLGGMGWLHLRRKKP